MGAYNPNIPMASGHHPPGPGTYGAPSPYAPSPYGAPSPQYGAPQNLGTTYSAQPPNYSAAPPGAPSFPQLGQPGPFVFKSEPSFSQQPAYGAPPYDPAQQTYGAPDPYQDPYAQPQSAAPMAPSGMENQIQGLVEGQREFKKEIEEIKTQINDHFAELEDLKRVAEHARAVYAQRPPQQTYAAPPPQQQAPPTYAAPAPTPKAAPSAPPGNLGYGDPKTPAEAFGQLGGHLSNAHGAAHSAMKGHASSAFDTYSKWRSAKPGQ